MKPAPNYCACHHNSASLSKSLKEGFSTFVNWQIIAFARVLLRAERERFSSGAAIHCARGRLGHRPVRHVSDCEVLAALVPERVLPSASGGSRKRGLSRAEAKNLGECRGGAPKGERARSMRSKAL